MRTNVTKILLATSVCASSALAPLAAYAEFTLNWTAAAPGSLVGNMSTPYASCNTGSEVACTLGIGSDPDKTPFIQERVRAPDGQVYYHLLIGDPNNPNQAGKTFGVDVFVKAGGDSFTAAQGSSSLGSPFLTGNKSGQDPLNPSVGGSGTGVPTDVIFRMVNADGPVYQEVLKDNLLTKPMITQDNNNGAIAAQFKVDLRSLGYQTADASAPMINAMKMFDPALVGGVVAWDINALGRAPNAGVTAGQYTWIPNPNTLNGAGGTWKYADGTGFGNKLADGSYDLNINWLAFRDPTQNYFHPLYQ